jgi:hypothetical protein
MNNNQDDKEYLEQDIDVLIDKTKKLADKFSSDIEKNKSKAQLLGKETNTELQNTEELINEIENIDKEAEVEIDSLILNTVKGLDGEEEADDNEEDDK